MKYQVVKAFSIEDFELFVNAQIQLGWEPIGGICFEVSRYMQAMVKKEKDITGENVISILKNLAKKEKEK